MHLTCLSFARSKQSDACQRIAKVEGIGPKTATVVVAAIGKGTEFKNGRHFAAWLGLVPPGIRVATDRC